MNILDLKSNIQNGAYDTRLTELYAADETALQAQKTRYLKAIDEFEKLFHNVNGFDDYFWEDILEKEGFF